MSIVFIQIKITTMKLKCSVYSVHSCNTDRWMCVRVKIFVSLFFGFFFFNFIKDISTVYSPLSCHDIYNRKNVEIKQNGTILFVIWDKNWSKCYKNWKCSGLLFCTLAHFRTIEIELLLKYLIFRHLMSSYLLFYDRYRAKQNV